MSLPKIKSPIFEMTIPSQKKEVKFRPFVVKEEKILLIAQQSGEDKQIVNSIKQVLNNCIIDKIDIDSLATFDLEYMFLKLRAKSVDNIVEVSYRDTEDDKVYDFTIDLDEVQITENPELSNKIKVNDEVGIIMKYPSVNLINGVPKGEGKEVEALEYLVANCIHSVYDNDGVYIMNEQSEEEIQEFIESLDLETYDKIRMFFADLPKMHYEIKYTNAMGNERVIELTSLRDFFSWG